jgi:hypothetical protein
MPLRPAFSLKLVVPAALVGVAAVGVATAGATDTQLEAQPCVISLAPQYTANASGELLVRPIPDSAIACPGFAFDSQTISVNIDFRDAAGAGGPALRTSSVSTYDAALNRVVETTALQLTAWGTSSATGIFTQVAPDYSQGSFWLTNPADSKNYRLVLGAPFQVTRTTPAPPACTLRLASRYAYKWDQENYFVIPDSAVRCDGFTYTSQSATLSMYFNSRVMGAGDIRNIQRRVFNRSTGTYSRVWELRLTSYGSNSQSPTAFTRENGLSAPAGSGGWTWGRFTQGTEGATVNPDVNPDPLQSYPQYRLTLARSFAIKRATTVRATTRRLPGGSTRVNIHADRNWSFQNGVAPTYRRQTVLPATPADRAVLKVGGTVVRRIKLSPYGNASITIPAGASRRSYSVTLVETDNNFAGTATFRA